jgi:hypothetical protein
MTFFWRFDGMRNLFGISWTLLLVCGHWSVCVENGLDKDDARGFETHRQQQQQQQIPKRNLKRI